MKTHLARRAMLVNNKYVSRTLLKMMFQLANKIKFVFLAMTVLIFPCQTVARMPVPKFVCRVSCTSVLASFIDGDVPLDTISVV